MPTNIITPEFIQMMRSSDYQGTSYAFAELIDNSFDANAQSIKLICIEKRDADNKRYIDEILFCDDGEGMDDQTLNNCLTFAYGTNRNIDALIESKKIGKFGMGLPNSSISQCERVEVYSKQVDLTWRRKYLDIKELLDNESTELPESCEEELPKHFSDIGAIIDENKGTIVSWKRCDRLDRRYSSTLFNRTEPILGRLFRYHLSLGKSISLLTFQYNSADQTYLLEDPRKVVLYDPLFLKPNTYLTKILKEESRRDNSIEDATNDPATYYSKFVEGLADDESRPTNQRLEDHTYTHNFKWQGETYPFTIATSHAVIDIQKPGIREGGGTKVGREYGKKMNLGNIYFTRHNREISCGHFGFYNQQQENNRWWTVEIDFDVKADELMGVSNTKQGIKFTKMDDRSPEEELYNEHTASLQQARDELWFQLTNKIKKAIKESQSVLKEQAKEWENRINQDEDEGEGPIPSGTAQTTQAYITTDSPREGQFDPEQKKDLHNALAEKYPNLSIADITKAIDKFDKSLVRGCILYTSLDSDQLWSQTEIRGFLTIFINTNHQFYEKIIAPFRRMGFDSALTSIELFISSLAWEENEHFDSDDKARHLRNFRTFVGVHLNNYLEENDIEVRESDFEQFLKEFAENVT